jgi:hypothetical protein
MAKTDAVHYFDIFYHHGPDWLERQFDGPKRGRVRIEMTQSYSRSEIALERIALNRPTKGVVICLRDPIDRAFSHYWHEKKKKRFDYSFREILENYDLWSDWVEPGRYAPTIQRCIKLFGREHVLVQFFDDLVADPVGYYSEFCEFCGLRSDIEPSVANTKINTASPQLSISRRRIRTKIRQAVNRVGLGAVPKNIKPALERTPLLGTYGGDKESLAGVESSVISELIDALKDDVYETGRLVDKDLSHWLDVNR